MLKNILLNFTLLATPFISLAFADRKEIPVVIQWEKRLDEAIAKAKTTGKPILLDIFMIG
ncbi:MAG: hypothetical protein JETT_1783 [Candidatus Jettenia ecosi]|uniref:Uncharacterized protein n=1 Tax=Candidatus Jettenia ecosi TaxID=2494326 RepID=A0A533QBA8_9BACT|nr:MAG: hypothetical protein JETT_1783 [Candidatus Jettenia ecosi]